MCAVLPPAQKKMNGLKSEIKNPMTPSLLKLNDASESVSCNEGNAMDPIPTIRAGGPTLPLAEIAGTPRHMHMPYMSLEVHHGLEPVELPLRGREVSKLDLS